MVYNPIKKNNKARCLMAMSGCGAILLFAVSRFVDSYRWAYEFGAVILLTVMIYLFSRYQIDFSYELKLKDSGRNETISLGDLSLLPPGQIEFIVWKKAGKKTPFTDARFYLSELAFASEWPSVRKERRQLLKQNGVSSAFRYNVSMGAPSSLLLVFKDEGYGSVALVVECPEWLDYLKKVVELNSSNDEEA